MENNVIIDLKNISIAFDEDPAGHFYDNTAGTGFLGIISDQAFGNIHLRPNFGKSGEVGIKGNTIPASQLNLYPNPAKETLNIELSGQEIEKITVYNSAGATVFSSATKSVGSNYKLNTAQFNSGVYFISVQTKTGIVSSKFIVK